MCWMREGNPTPSGNTYLPTYLNLHLNSPKALVNTLISEKDVQMKHTKKKTKKTPTIIPTVNHELYLYKTKN